MHEDEHEGFEFMMCGGRDAAKHICAKFVSARHWLALAGNE